MAEVLPLLLGVLLAGFVTAGVMARRAGMRFRWGPAWIAVLFAALATALGEHVLAARAFGAFCGTLFTFLLLGAAFDQVGRRVPRWILAAGLATGALRAWLRTEGLWDASEWLSVGVELPVILAAAAVLWRGGTLRSPLLMQRLLVPSMLLLAAAEIADSTLKLGFRIDFAWAPWLALALPAASIHVLATLEEGWARSRHAEARRRRGEEQLRKAQELAHVGSWEWDLVRGSLDLSDESYRILGREPGTPMDIDRFAEAVVPEDRAHMERVVEAALTRGESIEIEYRARRPDGDIRVLRGRGEARFDEHGRPVAICGVTQDVTERVRAEEQRRRLEERLRETQKLDSLGLLAAGVAHDFQNLLTGVLGNLDVATSRLEPESDARAALEDARLAAEHASELTDQLLVQAGRAKIRLEPLSLSRITRHALRLVRSSAGGIRLEATLPDPGPVVIGDRVQLGQVVVNLATNALAACRGHGTRVTVRCGRLDADATFLSECLPPDAKPGPYAWIEVADDGCGMDAATRRQIFDPFFTTRTEGRGLGLAVTLGIVRQHGGVIHVRSAPGAGTVFRVLLPADRQAPLAEDGSPPDA